MAFLVTLPIAGALAAVYNKKIEEGIPVAMFIATIVTYLCGIFGFLSFSPFVVGALSVLGIGICIWRLVKDHTVKRYVTFGGCMFLLMGMYYALVVKGRMIGGQDDLLVYGKYVADFYNVGKIFRFDYIPGMMMWEYLSERFWTVFSESVLFWSVAMMCTGMMLAIFSAESHKKNIHYFFVAIIILLFPIIVKDNESYFRLQNDFVMGVTMAYVMIMYQKSRDNKDRFYELATYLGLSFLTLTKVTGMILALILVLLLFGIDVVSRADKITYRSISYVFNCFLCVVISKLSWTITVRIHGKYEKFSDFSRAVFRMLQSHFYIVFLMLFILVGIVAGLKWIAENGYSKTYIAVLLVGGMVLYGYTYIAMPSDIRNDALRNFGNVFLSIYAPYRNFGFGYRFSVPYIVVIMLLMFIWRILFLGSNKDEICLNSKIIIYLNVGLFIFSAFLFLSNYYTRDPGQAARAKECERYIYAYIVFYIIVCLYQFTRFDNYNYKLYKTVLSFLSIIILIIANTAGIVTQVYAKDDYYNFDGLNYVDINYNDVFYYIDQQGKLDYSRFNFRVSPATTVNNYFSDMMVDGYWLGTNESDRYLTQEEWEGLLKNCTYVYVATTNEEFADMYGDFFADEIIDGRIYYVDKNEESTLLRSIKY